MLYNMKELFSFKIRSLVTVEVVANVGNCSIGSHVNEELKYVTASQIVTAAPCGTKHLTKVLSEVTAKIICAF